MIVETAQMSVVSGAEGAFLAALRQAAPLVLQSPGCQGMTVQQGVERPQTFLLLIRWASLSDHVDGFRNSPQFVQWRELLGPYFADSPVVEHWEPVVEHSETVGEHETFGG